MARSMSLVLSLLAGAVFQNFTAPGLAQTSPDPSPKLTVLPTFTAAGLKFDHNQGDCDPDCDTVTVRYREAVDASWRDAVDMMYDPYDFATGQTIDGQYRSSIVNLSPDTRYEVEVTVNGATVHYQTFTTWKETDNWPVGRITKAAGPVTITTSGTPDGYHLVNGTGVTVDGGAICVRVEASYVIVRGFTCVNQSGNVAPVSIENGRSDVLIDQVEISGWGDGGDPSDSWMGHAVTVGPDSGGITSDRIVLQHSYIHDPGWGPPPEDIVGSFGPRGFFTNRMTSGHSYVVRYNTFSSDGSTWFSDVIGGTQNGSVNASGVAQNMDIYGNHFDHCADDCIEAEGQVANVRIHHNFITHYAIAIATAAVYKGPLYIYRNALGVARGRGIAESGQIKVRGQDAGANNWHGRVYIYHNSFLNVAGPERSDGVPEATQGNHWAGEPRAQTTANNIWQVKKAREALAANRCYGSSHGADQANHYDHEMYWDELDLNACSALANGIRARPSWGRYTTDPGSGELAYFTLQSGTAGHDGGKVIPNFSDGYTGAAPDVGIMENDADPMCFGHRCARGMDFGDSPDGYSTLAADNGARHAAIGIMLGATRDFEPDGQPSSLSDGDETHGSYDEDGVSFGSALTAGESALVSVSVSQAGRLDGWIDYNADGDWYDADEHVFASQPVYAGSNLLTIAVPDDASNGSVAFARFRVSSSGGLGQTGLAADGEVEDYRLVLGESTTDTDNDGMTDSYEIDNGLDPYTNDANGDKDNDGLTNLTEFDLGTKADNVDSDGDGIADAQDHEPLLFSNECGDDPATLSALYVPAGQTVQCQAETSITVQDGVTVEAGGRLELMSSAVVLERGFSVPVGGELRVAAINSKQ